MITWKEWNKYPERYWKGKLVKTLVDMENGAYTIPAGTMLVIDRKYKGAGLRGLEVCQHCKIGMKISITRVPPVELELVK